MPVDWQTFAVPLAAGVNTKVDPRALNVPGIADAIDVQFEDLGGIRKRFPFPSQPSSIVGGGSITSGDMRRIVQYKDERLLFTKNAIYSWSEHDQGWVYRVEYHAPELNERTVFARTGNQVMVDRAEVDGVVVFCWYEADNKVYVAAEDAETGAVLLTPTKVTAAVRSPRLQPLQNRVLLFAQTGATTLGVLSINPDSLAASAAGAFTAISANYKTTTQFDVDAVASTVAVVAFNASATDTYIVAKINEDGTVATSAAKARDTIDDAIAVAVNPLKTVVTVVRRHGGTILADNLDTSLVDISVDILTGATHGAVVNHIVAGYRTTQDSGQYRCYIFWTEDQAITGGFYATYTTWVNDAGSANVTERQFAVRMGVVSAPFDHEGTLFLWMAFEGSSNISLAGGGVASSFSLQNSYFLYRYDHDPQNPANEIADLAAKACYTVAGGLQPGSFSTYHATRPQTLGNKRFAWCGLERRIISPHLIGKFGEVSESYGDYGPREVIVTMDSDVARRTVELGDTLYITGGQLLQYDGTSLTEVGFHLAPWFFDGSNGGAGSVEAGDHRWTSHWRWDNGKGERERSTTASFFVLTVGAGTQKINFSIVYLNATRKRTASGEVAIELYRTQVAPDPDSTHNIVTSQNPADTGLTSNKYILNDVSGNLASFQDNYNDATASATELDYEDSGELENVAPPCCKVMATGHERLFLGGIGGAPNQVWYSKQHVVGNVIAFTSPQTLDLPAIGGGITGIAFLNETLFVFKEHAIFAMPGQGPDALGNGGDYGPPQLISSDIGLTSADLLCVTPQGIFFHSSKGWFLLDRSFTAQYIGLPVEDFNDQSFTACTLMEKSHEIRCLSSSGYTLVYDYVAGQWVKWTQLGRHGSVVDDSYHLIAADGSAVKRELDDHDFATGANYSWVMETPWIKLNEIAGYGRLGRVELIGEVAATVSDAAKIRVRMAFDYDPTWRLDKSWTMTPVTAGLPVKLRTHVPSGFGLATAIKIRFEDVDHQGATTTLRETCRITGLSLELGIKKGLGRLSASRSQ